jgi:hypothetical protein
MLLKATFINVIIILNDVKIYVAELKFMGLKYSHKNL